MNLPLGEIPNLPPELRDKINQINDLLEEIQTDLAGLGYDLAGGGDWIPPWRKGYNQNEIRNIIDIIGPRDPFRSSYSELNIEGVEMNQSTQYYDLYGQGSGENSANMVPLVANKDMILRVYVERSSNPAFRRTDFFDGVVRYRGKEVKSLNGPRRLQTGVDMLRRVYNDSLNFRIPAADCTGSVRFDLQIFQSPKPSPIFNNARVSIRADFHRIPPLRVSGVLIRFTGNNQDLPAPGGMDLVNTLARFRPMFPIPAFDYNVCTMMDYDGDLTASEGWDTLIDRIRKLRQASTVRTIFVGLLPAAVATLTGAAQRGIGDVGLAIASQNDTRALSHEFGHACDLPHIDAGGAPEPFDTRYPNYSGFPFGSIGEVGIHTGRRILFNPDTSFDFMTYMDGGSPPPEFPTNTWISPYNYRKMMHFIRLTNGTADVESSLGGVGGMRLLLSFRMYRGGRVEIRPSYLLSGLPNAADARTTVPLMLDLYDRDGRVISSHRCHRHNPYQDSDGPYLDFVEEVPWPESVGEIVFVREREEVDRVRAAGMPAPGIRLEGVRRVEEDQPGDNARGDIARVEWTLDSSASEGALGVLVRYTPDGGQTWYAVAEEHPGQEQRLRHLVNLNLLPGGDDCRFEVIASSGLAFSSAQSEPFRVRIKPRRAYLVTPQNEQTFRYGEPIEFAGTAHSPDHGMCALDSVTWSSSRDGLLGTGATIVRDDLQPGTHRITLNAPGGREEEVSASVWITIHEEDDDRGSNCDSEHG